MDGFETMSHMDVRVTYYTEVTSSWCYWVEPIWAELKKRYENRVEFGWKIALLPPEALPKSRQQAEWFYRRSGLAMRSPFMLEAGWLNPNTREYLAPNCTAEGAREFGIHDDSVRLALAEAGLRQGADIGDWEFCTTLAAKLANVRKEELMAVSQSPAIESRVRNSTHEFNQFQVQQRPAFLVEDAIGDRAIFSGVVAMDPLVQTIEAMLRDCAFYASYAAHHGTAPEN